MAAARTLSSSSCTRSAGWEHQRRQGHHDARLRRGLELELELRAEPHTRVGRTACRGHRDRGTRTQLTRLISRCPSRFCFCGIMGGRIGRSGRAARGSSTSGSPTSRCCGPARVAVGTLAPRNVVTWACPALPTMRGEACRACSPVADGACGTASHPPRGAHWWQRASRPAGGRAAHHTPHRRRSPPDGPPARARGTLSRTGSGHLKLHALGPLIPSRPRRAAACPSGHFVRLGRGAAEAVEMGEGLDRALRARPRGRSRGSRSRGGNRPRRRACDRLQSRPRPSAR